MKREIFFHLFVFVFSGWNGTQLILDLYGSLPMVPDRWDHSRFAEISMTSTANSLWLVSHIKFPQQHFAVGLAVVWPLSTRGGELTWDVTRNLDVKTIASLSKRHSWKACFCSFTLPAGTRILYKKDVTLRRHCGTWKPYEHRNTLIWRDVSLT